MGNIRLGPPADLIKQIADTYGIQVFVETGTYYGKTALWASSIFEQTITIEYSREIYETNLQTYKENSNISFRFGDSRAVLKEIVPTLTEPAIFWLDGHWSGAETYGEDDQCPLIDEILTINLSPVSHIVLIDDARLFTSPPPLPHPIDQWPTIKEVIDTLCSGGKDYYVVIIEDVIIAAPNFARDFIAGYCQTLNTELWQKDSEQIMKMWQAYTASGKSATQTPNGKDSSLRVRLSRYKNSLLGRKSHK
jgi:hypothetical protein